VNSWVAESVLSFAPSAGDVALPPLTSNSDYNNNPSNPFFPSYAPDSIGGSIGSLGNCTWYAYGRMLEKGHSSATLNKFALGNANTWYSNGVTVSGITIDTSPSTDSIAELDITTGWTLGHVAYVESVNGDGTITVSESGYSTSTTGNWNFLWRHRTCPTAWWSHYIHVP